MATKIVKGDLAGGVKLNRYLRELALRLGEGGEAKVGFLPGASYPQEQGGQSVAQVAFWNEFGTKNAPPRPFFRNMIEDQRPTWARKLGAAAKYTGYRARPTLEIVAADIKGHIVESIFLLEDPPLAESTVARKGFAKPLVDTRLMARSVEWAVTNGKPAK